MRIQDTTITNAKVRDTCTTVDSRRRRRQYTRMEPNHSHNNTLVQYYQVNHTNDQYSLVGILFIFCGTRTRMPKSSISVKECSANRSPLSIDNHEQVSVHNKYLVQ